MRAPSGSAKAAAWRSRCMRLSPSWNSTACTLISRRRRSWMSSTSLRVRQMSSTFASPSSRSFSASQRISVSSGVESSSTSSGWAWHWRGGKP